MTRIQTGGFLYLMMVIKHRFYTEYFFADTFKIGITCNPVQRIRDINDPLPIDMITYHSIYYQRKVLMSLKDCERKLHILFGSQKKTQPNRPYGGPEWREWFYLYEYDMPVLDKAIKDCGFERCLDGFVYHTDKIIYNHRTLGKSL